MRKIIITSIVVVAGMLGGVQYAARAEDGKGVLVASVKRGMPAAKAGLRVNDIITKVDGHSVAGVTDFQRRLEDAFKAGKSDIDMTIQRYKVQIKTSLHPYYDLKSIKIGLVLPPADVQYLDLILSELISSGAEITLVSKNGKKVKDGHGLPVITLKDAKSADFDLILFAEGTGTRAYWANESVLKLIRESCENKKHLAAIGSASIILLAGDKSLLEKKITTSREMSGEATRRGAHYTGSDVEWDGNIITTTGTDKQIIRKFLNDIRVMGLNEM